MGRGMKRLLLAVILVIAIVLRLRGITNPLLDNQAWRQADTASMATHMMGHLMDFPRVFIPQLNYDGVTPQNVELEFPFLPYLLAWTWTLFGWSDLWGRLWSVGLSLLTVLGIYDLGKNVFSERAGLLAAAIYALMPLSIYYGRVVMPEPMAQAWSIWALTIIWRWRVREQEKGLWKAALFMAGAILAKLPQLMLFPVALTLGFWPLQKGRLGQIVRYSMIVLIPPMVYYLWVHFNVSASSRFVSGILTGQVANTSNIDWSILEKNIQNGYTKIVIYLSAIGLLRLLLFPSHARMAILAWAGISGLYVGVACARIPLDYYLVPVMLLAALLSAFALDMIPSLPGTVIGLVFLILIHKGSYTDLTPKYHWDQNYLSQGVWIKEHTEPSAVLVLSDSPPMTFYYAQRVGFRLSAEANAETLDQLPADYLVRLPQSAQKDPFWEKVKTQYPEVGPGVFDLKERRE
ncbi:PMT family glycosyltransferase, 4-amino-4-deoxy-L-arabinose transferase [Desulfosporosinus orientis DSM 765]|uniref:PMT family glycosyltransferase, 4-amino-4-deoxy-L-arabinose transferase n=1 Tax=Desulfosporosinus orientis (strain ATCC 19365 / DSM 765 / NCIMB 8382 / VKM B-1628 / Singapore I) TaxID=768706 RepID=G7WAK5_DESOD|nr:glycosyltransferase family 39 protein [Desulfosporosinus orientis]AET66773.1 PMT family glycosyltransferase, 4-amino-4-deoxy-L-arabinose transferase [Desulfosporosinus orientis DSM 765]